ncbi:uncharacterized protein TRIADDRAFT_57880 [Trichoplax adhaerens]|uniref:Vitellogenin domain-containing protein n=1 Tax=Trichoplax adhaerens TaxID=10228 RepID=B3S1T7_TRIAD|nr:hypothetical protein TRIADDRAFT_57880 [Trichoplax adhaerens]EDV23033.1 hypothetical protein TRIADDRAFT_57880 [Trichoplax adhaerens]|eukprot:XP_002113943.1 hypothetical protein TRIADDRAFT_57880 [Trichoplax adhaerens]
MLSSSHWKAATTIHKDTNILKPGYLYSYEYEGDTASGIYATSDKFAGLMFKAKANIGIPSNNLRKTYLKLERMQVFSFNGTWPQSSSSQYQPVKVSDTFLKHIHQPVTFDYENGRVGNIYAQRDETDEAINIKRGVINLFHLPGLKSIQKHPQIVRDLEEGIEGKCESIYHVQESSPQNWIIVKARNMNNCSCCPSRQRSIWNLRNQSCETQQSKFLRSNVVTRYQLNSQNKPQYDIEAVETEASHVFSPFRGDKGSAMTVIRQKLKRTSQKQQSIPLPGNLVSRGPIGFQFWPLSITDNPAEPNLNAKEEALKMLEKIAAKSESEGTDPIPYYFIHLINALRGLSQTELRNIYQNRIRNPKERQWLLDALTSIGNSESMVLLGQLISSKILSEKDAPHIFIRIPMAQNVTEPMVESLLTVCKLPEVRNSIAMHRSCWLAYGSSIFKMCNSTYNWKNCPTKYVQVLHTSLNKVTSNKDKLLCLKAIGNAGSPSSLPVLAQKINQTSLSQDERVAAIYAMRRIAIIEPKEVISTLLPIHLSHSENTEIRIASVVVIFDTKPSLAVLELVADGVRKEMDQQVASFVYSHLVAVSSNKLKCSQELASNAYLVLKTLKPIGNMFQSRSYLVSAYSKILKMGSAIDVKMIYDSKTKEPRSVCVKFISDALSYTTSTMELSKFITKISNVNSTFYLKYFGDEVYFDTFNSTSIIEIISQLQRQSKSANGTAFYPRSTDLLYGSMGLVSSAISSGIKIKSRVSHEVSLIFRTTADISTGEFDIYLQPYQQEKTLVKHSLNIYNYVRVQAQQPRYTSITESKLLNPTKFPASCYEISPDGRKLCLEALYYRPTRNSPWLPFTGPMQSRIWIKPSSEPRPIHISYRHLPSSDKMIRKSMLAVQFLSRYQRELHIKYDGHTQMASYRLTASDRSQGGKQITVGCVMIQFPVNMSMPLSIHMGYNCSYDQVVIACNKQQNSTVFQVSGKTIGTTLYVNKISDMMAPYTPTDLAVITRNYTNRYYPTVDIATDAFTPQQFTLTARAILTMDYTDKQTNKPSSPIQESKRGATCLVDIGTVKTFNNATYHYLNPGDCPLTLATDCSGNGRFTISEELNGVQKIVKLTFSTHVIILKPNRVVLVDNEKVIVNTNRPYNDPSRLFTITLRKEPVHTYVIVNVKNHFIVTYGEISTKITYTAKPSYPVCGMCGYATQPKGLNAGYNAIKEWIQPSASCHGGCPLKLTPKVAKVGSQVCFTSRPTLKCKPGCTPTGSLAVPHHLFCPDAVAEKDLTKQYISNQQTFNYELLRTSSTRVVPTIISEDYKCQCSPLCDLMH